jgi:hypothetical protein
MGESVHRRRVASKLPSERLFQNNKFGTIVRALWPHKPALNLSQRIGISERGAQYLIDGKRRVSAKALHVINTEILAG